MQHECEEADQGVRLDPLGKPLEDQRDFDAGLQNLEAALDVSQALVTLHHLGGREIGHDGHSCKSFERVGRKHHATTKLPLKRCQTLDP